MSELHRSSPCAFEVIQRLAYEIFEKRGGADGHAIDDWLEAEARLRDAVHHPPATDTVVEIRADTETVKQKIAKRVRVGKAAEVVEVK